MSPAIEGSDAKKAEKMLKEGKSFDEVFKALHERYSYKEIQAFAWESGALNWLGIKRAISNRLKKIPTATRQQDRTDLVDEINEFVNYLYYAGREQQSKLERSRKLLKKLKQSMGNIE